MKALLAAFVLCSGAAALAEDVQVIVHQVEVSHERMSSLLAEGLSEPALFTKVRGMISAKSATLRDTSLMRLRTGERATIESIREVIYLTEADPDSFRFADPKEREESLGWMKLPPEEQRKYWARKLLAFSFLPVVPSLNGKPEFETRNVGFTLELSCEEKAPELQWSLEYVGYERDTEIGRTLGLDGKPRIQRMPNFDMMSLRGDSPLAKGITLAGVLTPVAAEGGLDRDRKIMVFVKADILEEK